MSFFSTSLDDKHPEILDNRVDSDGNILLNLEQPEVSKMSSVAIPIMIHGNSLVQAIRTGQIKDVSSISDKMKGLLQNVPDEQSQEGMSLSEALQKGLVESQGKILDRFSGKSVKLSEAIKRGLINPHKLEIYDSKVGLKITLKEALEKNVITDSGKYKNLTLNEAMKKKLICQPMTLKECDDAELLNGGKIKDPVTNKPLTILEGIGQGVLDVDLKSVRDVKENVLVSLGQALVQGIVSLDGKFQDTSTSEMLTLAEAVKKGHLTTVSKKSIFDIEGIKDVSSGDYVSFNQALKQGLIDQATGKFVDPKTKQKIGFTEAKDKDWIQPQLLEMLKKPIGIYSADKKRELSLLEAVTEGQIDPNSGLIINTATKNTVPMDKALELQLITSLGVAVLKSLLNITVTTATVTQTVKRYIQVSASSNSTDAITFQDALRRGLIDDTTGIFTHPNTGKELLLDEAINLGLLKLSPNSSLKSSPVSEKASSARKSSAEKVPRVKKSSVEKTRPASPKRSAVKSVPLKKESSLQVEFSQNTTNGTTTNTTQNGNGTTRRSSSVEVKNNTTSKSSMSVSSSSKSSSLTRKSSRASSQESRKNTSSVPTSPTKSLPSPTFGQSKMVPSEIPDMPVSGWPLQDAIDFKLFDPQNGMFHDGLPFGTVLQNGTINGTSATVATTDEHGKGITLTLKKAFEQGIVTEDGQYHDGRKLVPMQEAIMNGKIWHVWKSAAQKAKENAKAAAKPKQSGKSNGTTGKFQFTNDMTASDLLQALKEGRVKPQDIQVKLKNNAKCNIVEAIRDGILDKNTGIYTSPNDEKMTLLEAIRANYIFLVDHSGLKRPQSIDLNGSSKSIRDGTIKARVIESGITTTRISTFLVQVPGTDEEITLEEAVTRGLISEETAKTYREEVSTTTDSISKSLVVLITCPITGIEMRSEEAVSKGIVTEEDVQYFLKMYHQEQLSKVSKKSEVSESSSSSSSSSDEASYRSEITIDFGAKSPDSITSSSISKCIVLLKTGYVLSNTDEVRNLATGETMSIYEAKLRGIASDVQQKSSENIEEKISVSNAVSRGLINFEKGTFTNPNSGEIFGIIEAIKFGILITDIETHTEIIDLNMSKIGLTDALKFCFDSEKRLFTRKSTNESFTLSQSIEENWINGQDILLDISSNTQKTVKRALDEGLINGQSCEYRINQEYMFMLDAAKQGLIAIFPEVSNKCSETRSQYTLKETIETGIFNHTTQCFKSSSKTEITISEALKTGLVDFRSAQIFNTETRQFHNLNESLEMNLLNGQNCQVKDVKSQKSVPILEAFQTGLVKDTFDIESNFEILTFWQAIERHQLDTETGMFYSIHEEKKTMTLEEAIYRKYIDKKSALVKDTWKRQFHNLGEASKKKIIKNGRIMNTTTGRFLSVSEAINIGLIVREIRLVSLMEILDFGLYLPHSGRIAIPGLDREMTLGEALESQVIDHTRTIVKSRKNNRFISLYEAIQENVIDPCTGMYASSMNLLEARSKGYLLSRDAMVGFKL